MYRNSAVFRRALTFLLSAVLMLSLAGCRSETEEGPSSESAAHASDDSGTAAAPSDGTVLSEALQAAARAGTSGKVSLTYVLSQTDEEESTEITLGFTGTWSGDPVSGTDWMGGTATVTQFGNPEVLEMESYAVDSGEGSRCYTHVSDSWSYRDLSGPSGGCLGSLLALSSLTEEAWTFSDQEQEDGEGMLCQAGCRGSVLDESLSVVLGLLRNSAVCDAESLENLSAEILCTLDTEGALRCVRFTLTDPDGSFYASLPYNGVEGELTDFSVELTVTGDGSATPSLPGEAESLALEEIAAEDIDEADEGDDDEDEDDSADEEWILDEEGRLQIWDNSDTLFAWIACPDGCTPDEMESGRYGAVFYREEDGEDLDASYYLYDTDEGYLDLNMTDPFYTETAYFDTDDDFSYEGPSDTREITVGDLTVQGASLSVLCRGEDGDELWIQEYILWCHPDERTIVACTVHSSRDTEGSFLSMEEAAALFFAGVSLE